MLFRSGEGQLRSSVLAVELFDGPCHGAFIVPRHEYGGEPFQHLVVQGHRGFDEAYFFGVLDGAELFHEAVGGFEREAGVKALDIAPREMLGLDADGLSAEKPLSRPFRASEDEPL